MWRHLGPWGPQPSTLTAWGMSCRQSATASLAQTSLTQPEQRRVSRRTRRRRRSARRRPRQSGLGVQRPAERPPRNGGCLLTWRLVAELSHQKTSNWEDALSTPDEIGVDLVRLMPCQLALTVARLADNLSERTLSTGAWVAGTSAGWVALTGTARPSSKGLRNAPV